MAKIMGAELYEDLSQRGIELLGPAAARAGTVFDYGLRMSVMYVVGGGTNDVLRNVLARSLGLPR
jgi:alkylation response protein AidB-like acyl-CoA dehydrogenase